MILAWLLNGKKIELVIDGTIVDIANVNRARTQKMAAIWMSVRLGFLPALAFGTLRNGKAFSRSMRICW